MIWSTERFIESKYSRIIILLCWISLYQTSRLTNLRRNQDEEHCMSEWTSSHSPSEDQFTASSYSQNKPMFQPSMARLLDIHSQSSSSDGGAWCPATAVHKTLTEWIEVDFRRMTIVNTLYTMGRGDGNFKEFTPEVVIKYQRVESGLWYTYHDAQNFTTIAINTDARSKIRTSLRPIVVTKIRIYPLDTGSGPKFVCLKLAFLGCYFDDEVVSYTAPQGDIGLIMNHSVNLQDNKYDGTKGTVLQNGLGLLMDNNVQIDIIDVNSEVKSNMNNWFYGWKCSQQRHKSTINIIFYYAQERIFSQISVYHVKSVFNNITLSSPIVISISHDNTSQRAIYNKTHLDQLSGNLLKIPLDQHRGSILTLSITCSIENWIILSEIEITSTKANDIPMRSTNYVKTTPLSVRNSTWGEKEISYIMAIGIAVVLLIIFLSCVAFLFYKMKKLKKYKLNKKLELVTKCSDRNMCNPSSRTVFTIQSNHPSVSSVTRDHYYSDNKHVSNNTYAGSQPSDGVYASWPNTDEDADVPNLDHEEEKCLLGVDIGDSRSVNKEYAIYQPGVNYIASDYFLNTPPSSTLISLPIVTSLSEKVPLSVAHLKLSSSYDLPRSTPIVSHRNSINVISYQHLINYRGICGDVDLRYQSVPTGCEPHGLDSNIKVLSTTSIVCMLPWVRGQFGCIDIVTVTLEKNATCQYFMKQLSADAPPFVKSKFILDLKILIALRMSVIAQLTAIVVESALLSNDAVDVIRSARFCLLIEHNGGYNLKEYLRNINYPNQTQNYKTVTTTLSSHSQISISSMLQIITQISGGMRHLEELGLTHRDLGCRNCTIDSRRQVKLYPGGYLTAQPFEDYYSIELQNHLVYFPLRWLAPESISKGLFTSKSDVWSFGVLMWEVFTLCSLLPYTSLTNEALMELMCARESSPRLPCPQNCPRELYDLMTQCWCWDESLRPTFIDINLFLQIKTAGATNSALLIFPAPPPSVSENPQNI